MVDFRYHALSLVAVFLALGIGVVLGVTVGDSLVSDADRNLRESLRDDVTEAREAAESEEELGARRDDVIEEVGPRLAASRLRGLRVALLAIDELPAEIADGVDEALEMGGGRLVRQAEVDPTGERGQRRWGVRVTRALAAGGPLLRRLARNVSPRFFSGSARGSIDAIVLYRGPPPEEESDDDRARREALTEGVVRRLRNSAIGVEALETEPSQVEWYDDAGVTASVDNIDTVAGQLALVLVLEDARREGRFGYKGSADRVLPDIDPSD